MLVHDTEIVSAVRLAVAQRVGQDRFDLWFSKSRFAIDNSTLHVESPNQFVLDWIRANFRESIEQACHDVTAKSLAFDFRVVETQSERDEKVVTDDTAKTESQSAVAPRRRFASLKTFLPGENNRVAYSAAKMVVNQPGAPSPLLLYGPTGVGKSHLLEGVWSAIRSGGRNRRCIYLTAEQFTSFFLEALHGSGLPSFRRRYRELDLLIVEDLQFFAGKTATLNELLFTVDSMLRDGRQLAFSSDRSPIELAQVMGPELSTRICGGLVANMISPELETRVEIARQIARQRSLELPNTVLQLVAERLTDDVRQLQGAINKLMAVHQAVGKPISYSLAEKALEEVFHNSQRQVQLRDIEHAICDIFGVDSERLKSSSKAREISHPRMLAMWLARKYTRAALSEIGEFFGHRSHSTVISAEKKVNRWRSDHSTVRILQNDCRVDEAIRQIETKLRVG